MDFEAKYVAKFGLNPDESVLISKLSCMYHGKGIPVPGNLFIFNDYVCFSSSFNQKTIIGKTKIILPIKELILCEFMPKKFGTGIAVTLGHDRTKGGPTFQFNNLGEQGKIANLLIEEMMGSVRSKDIQKQGMDDELIKQIETEQERKAIANSMIDVQEKIEMREQVVGQLIDDKPLAHSFFIQDKIMPHQQFIEEELKVEPSQYRQQEGLKIDPEKYSQQMVDDMQFIASHQELKELANRKFKKQVYSKTFKGVPAAALVNGIFVHRRIADEVAFPEQLSEFMKNSDQKIANIIIRIDQFEGGHGKEENSLDDILLHSDYALDQFYQGNLGIEMTRGQKERKVHVKTTLKKAIFLMKVFPYTENQKFYVVSPRKIMVMSTLQMEKVFYSDHYHVDLFWNFDEQMGPDGELETSLTLQCDLVFVKNVAMIKKKIQDYFEEHMASSFDNQLRPQLETWIQNEIIEPRNERKFLGSVHEQEIPKILQLPIQDEESAFQEFEQRLIPEQIVSNFINELKQQTSDKIDQHDLNKLIMDSLNKGQELILTRLINKGIDIDLSNPNINPEIKQIDGCCIF